ncbi:hypothetical protein MKQ70_23010 [Chitinophaga sedimenti]|nr:hypothetical protein [Chitinophaga sedimenti]
MKSFPKMDSLARIFSQNVDIIMIGAHASTYESYSETRLLIEDKVKKKKLSFPYALDSLCIKKFAIRGVPYILVINPEGKIVAKTISIDSTQLSDFINKREVRYRYAISNGERSSYADYNRKRLTLTTGKMSNGGYDTAFLFRSLLSESTLEMPDFGIVGFDTHTNSRSSELFGLTVDEMIKVACTGQPAWDILDSVNSKIYPKIIYDSTSSVINKLLASNKRYTYSLTLPNEEKAIRDRLKILLSTICATWEIAVSLEQKKMPVYTITVIDEKLLLKHKSKKNDYTVKKIGISDGFKSHNISIEKLVAYSNLQNLIRDNTIHSIQIPIVNDTEINYNLDIEFRADLEDYGSVKTMLKSIGLDISKSLKEMTCITVRDAED